MNRQRFVVAGLGLGVVLALVWGVSGWPPAGARPQAAVSAPTQLLAPAPTCGVSGANAHRRAVHLRQSAHSRWDRAAFDPSDGPRAMQELRTAADCYRAAGNREAGSGLRQHLQRWRTELLEDYRSVRLQLHLALEADDAGRVLRHAAHVRALLSQADEQADAYRAWLARLEQRARASKPEQQGTRLRRKGSAS